MRDLPHNTQLTGDIFMPNTSPADRIHQEHKQDWFSQNGWGYVSLAPGVDPDAVPPAWRPMLDRDWYAGAAQVRHHGDRQPDPITFT